MYLLHYADVSLPVFRLVDHLVDGVGL